jgi:hypothetical protein
MTDSELLDAARRIVRRARSNHIPPGPFLGGRVWDYIEAEICMEIINLVKQNQPKKPDVDA